MKRPVLAVCTSCQTDESWNGASFYEALRAARKARGYKALFKLKEADCLSGCDTPCNAELYGKGRPTLKMTWLHGVEDVAPLLEATRRYAEGDDDAKLPGRPSPD